MQFIENVDVDTLDKVAKLVENHGAMLVFALIMGILNLFYTVQIMRGRLVPYSVYMKAVDEADRLQATMERERSSTMERLLDFVGNLKKEDGGKE
jgi:hypothetical protein